jgi:putative hydrolase of the HAD superfamily
LLDVGGIFHLPDPERIRAAFARGGFDATEADFDRAHYAGAARFTVAPDGELDFRARWLEYLDTYVGACGVPPELRADVHEHLDSEFATGSLWSRVIPGSADGLRALTETGVRVGIVSNADGSVAQRLAEQEVLQVGPGLGVNVECVIDSGAVGVMKPDPRIFHIALDAMGIANDDAWYVGDMPGIDVAGARNAGIHPIVMDPYELHVGADYARVTSLHDVARLVVNAR